MHEYNIKVKSKVLKTFSAFSNKKIHMKHQIKKWFPSKLFYCLVFNNFNGIFLFNSFRDVKKLILVYNIWNQMIYHTKNQIKLSHNV